MPSVGKKAAALPAVGAGRQSPGGTFSVEFEKCFDLATGAAASGGDDDFFGMLGMPGMGGGCPASGIKFPYNSNTLPHARVWWSEEPGSSAALVPKAYDSVSYADVAQATFCSHLNDKKCLATSGHRKGKTIFDDASRVATDTMILQSAPGTYWKVGYISESGSSSVRFRYSRLVEAAPKPAWTHVATMGCSSVLTTGTYGSQSGSCWKGYSDAQINSMMVGGNMKIDFCGTPMYFKFNRAFATNPGQDNGVQWRNSPTESWRGACTHSSQYGHNYRWFHIKANSRTGSCQRGNFENTINPSSGFNNRDGSNFFPTAGWSSCITVYVKKEVTCTVGSWGAWRACSASCG